MNIELGIGIGGGTLFAPTSNDQLVAYAWASVVSPSVTTSAVVHKTVNAVPANSNASALTPAISSASNTTVLSVIANANGDALIPSVAIAGSISINAVIASSNSDSIIPVVSTIRNVSVNGVVANSTASAGVPTVTIGGAATYYLQMDGVDDYVTVPHIGAYVVSSHTVEMLVTLSSTISTTGQKDMISKGDKVFSLQFIDGTLRPCFTYQSAGWKTTDSPEALIAGQKYHIVGTLDFSSGTSKLSKIFINGVKKAEKTIVDSTAIKGSDPDAITIAKYSTRYFKGNIHQVRIYNRTLSESEVLDNYNNTVTRTGLIGEWLMTEGSGTLLHDTSGNNNSGTLLNGGTWVVA